MFNSRLLKLTYRSCLTFLVMGLFPLAAWANGTADIPHAPGLLCPILTESPQELDTISYGGLTFEPTLLGSVGFELTPKHVPVSTHAFRSPVVQSINRIWDQSQFLTPRVPLSLGEIDDKDSFEKVGVPRVLDMPIKLPDSNLFKVPGELEQFRSAIQKIIDFEYSVNPSITELYAYLTIDQKYVKAGQTQRNSGPHVDGIQGQNYPKKLRVDHSYLISNVDPTVFFTNAFDLANYDVNIDNFNTAFRQQADYRTAIRPKPFEIVTMDAFTVHESPAVSKGGWRTLLRLEFSEKVFDRLGNTRNPLLNYQWEMVPRPIPADLH